MSQSSQFTWRAILIAIAASTPLVPATAQWGGGQSRWRSILDYPNDFYGADESIRVAENVLLYQNDNGGWPKNIDMARPLSDGDRETLRRDRNRSETLIDNGATWTQIRFLARMHAATGDWRYADAANRGLHFLLEAQYPNGGWPMIYPLREGYYSHLTFNDGAMIGVMNLLRDVTLNQESLQGAKVFGFVDAATRERCQKAIDKGLDVILATQVVVDGQPTVWCAQYDEHSLQPAAARAYELPSLSGYESVGIVEYLMQLDRPTPGIKRAVDSAVAWFNRSKIAGERVEWRFDGNSKRPTDRVVVADPSAKPLWARFYSIDGNRPMFVGRDGVIHDHLADIEQERRVGYAWLGDWPAKLLEKDFPQWQAKWAIDKPVAPAAGR
ncbi:MAG: pectate lyase [Pirellulales bacterium]